MNIENHSQYSLKLAGYPDFGQYYYLPKEVER